MSRQKKKAPQLALSIDEQPNHGGKFTVELKNQYQKELWNIIHNPANKLIFIEGEAGCGKTHIATAAACQALLNKRTRKIHLVRPYVNSFETYGYLKGSLDEKLQPMLMPIFDIIENLCGGYADRKKIEEAIHYEPFGFMRGRTYNNWVVADEQQSSTFEMLKLLTTRIGRNCKMLVTFDPTQSDIKKVEIKDFISRIKHVEGVVHYVLPPESQVREPIVQNILKACDTKRIID